MPYKDPAKRKARRRARYAASSERRARNDKRVRDYYERSREIIKTAKDTPCADCGGSFPHYVMDFHHVDSSTKRCAVSQLRAPSALAAEIAKCVVLCANCHRIREHGGTTPTIFSSPELLDRRDAPDASA